MPRNPSWISLLTKASQGVRMANRDNVIETTIDEEESAQIDTDTACRALALLVQWALRSAKKRAERDNRSSGEVVTVEFSNGYTSRKAGN